MTTSQVVALAVVPAVAVVTVGLLTWKVLTRPARVPWLAIPVVAVVATSVVWGRAVSSHRDKSFHRALAIDVAASLFVSVSAGSLLAGWRMARSHESPQKAAELGR